MSFLTQRIEKLETTKSKMQIIRVDRIHLDPLNDTLYQRFDPESCIDDRDLIESIREVGLLQPLCVRPHTGLTDEYFVVAGHRRLQACQVVGIKKVECLILTADTEEEQIIMKMDLVLSNRTRDRSNPATQAKEVAFLENNIRELKKIHPDRFKGFTIRSLVAAELGVSERTVASAEKINNNLDSKTYSAFISGAISQREALDAADKIRINAGKKIKTDYLDFDATALPTREAISKILYEQLICAEAIEKIEDKNEFLAKVKEFHISSHHGHLDQNFISQFNRSGLVVKLPSIDMEVRLTPNQIYYATLWEYQSKQRNGTEMDVCINKEATLKTTCVGRENTNEVSALLLREKIVDCTSKMENNPWLWNDEIVQKSIYCLEKRITEFLIEKANNETNVKQQTEVLS